jgi:hypothetical protein
MSMNLTPEQAAAELQTIRTSAATAWAPTKNGKYFVVVGLLLGCFWAAMAAKSNAPKIIASILYAIGIGLAVSWQFKRHGRRPRNRDMPRRLQLAVALGVLVIFLLFVALAAATAALHLKQPWLWRALAAPFVMVLGGRLAEHIYVKAYATWKTTL